MRFFKRSQAEPGLITDWTSTTLAIASTGTTPVKGTVAYDKAFWRRVGENMEIVFSYQQTAGGTAGSGFYYLVLPNSHTIDFDKIFNLSAVLNPSCVGSGLIGSTSHPNYICNWNISLRDTNGFTCSGNNSAGDEPEWKDNVWDMAETSLLYSGAVSIPITGWGVS